MAFKLENFGSEVANVKNILGGICFYTYQIPTGETATDVATAGYIPSGLGLKEGDRIDLIAATPSTEAIARYIVNVIDGVISLTAESDL